MMGGIEKLIERNIAFARSGDYRELGIQPRLAVAVVCCLDPRVDPASYFGLELGDAAVIRNVGGRVTDAVIADLAYISQLSETFRPEGALFEVAVVHHTGCGSLMLERDDFRERYARRMGVEEASLHWIPTRDPSATVEIDVARILASAAISDRVPVSGHVYDVDTGSIRTIVPTTRSERGAPSTVHDR